MLVVMMMMMKLLVVVVVGITDKIQMKCWDFVMRKLLIEFPFLRIRIKLMDVMDTDHGINGDTWNKNITTT